MNCSVNLVPIARRVARTRNSRRNRWIGVFAGVAVVAALGWGIQQAAARALGRLSVDLESLASQRTETQRRLAAVNADREELLERLQTIAAARRPQPWARRLLDLTRQTPDTVFLTAITIGDSETDMGMGRPSRRPRASVTRREPPGTVSENEGWQPVQIRGLATDHPALIQFLNALQGLPGWQRAELVRAARESYRGVMLVAFEIGCQTLEDGT